MVTPAPSPQTPSSPPSPLAASTVPPGPATPDYPREAPASAALFARAARVTPGGVNSPVRAFGSVGGTPRFMASGPGPT